MATRDGMLKLLLVAGVVLACVLPATATESLWSHIDTAAALGDRRAVAVTFDGSASSRRLTMVATGGQAYAWATVPTPDGGWNLARRAAVHATIGNRGTEPVEAALWIVADAGWESVADFAQVHPGESRTFSAPLRATFPDGTPKLDPTRIQSVQVMIKKPTAGQTVEVTDLVAVGDEPPWTRPVGRIDVPAAEDGIPAAGRRVSYRPTTSRTEAETLPAALLYLPRDWLPGGIYPVVVEYPGNIFFTAGCYSTGRPEQCVIGYGMTRGEGAIWLSLPFVDAGGQVAENGWGDPDRTADFCADVVEDVCTRFGGDRSRLVLTGFSRGAIACGFIGLRNDRIAGLWKGLHCCQHFDGDGWNGATMPGAIERAGRFRGASVFHTDNSADRVKPVTDALGVPVTFVSSGLGAHSCAMFLDDRESTRRLREWFTNLTATDAEGRVPERPMPTP
ncbi:MAG: hypothetical protein ACKOEM_12390 [Planctomycetia bacterium]